MAYSILPLSPSHDVGGFACESEALNVWLHRVARQHQSKSLSKTFVITEDAAPGIIIGYYALAHRGLVEKEALPAALVKRLPSKIPGFLLARLAVSASHQGRGFGSLLLMDAISRVQQVAQDIGGPFLFVNAKDEAAASFYRQFGFTPLHSDPLTLVLSLG